MQYLIYNIYFYLKRNSENKNLANQCMPNHNFRKQNQTENGTSELVNKAFNSHKDIEYLIVSDE